MIKLKRKVIASVLIVGLVSSITGCTKKIEAKEVVKLESQKEIIDESLLVKSLDNFKDFKAEEWLEDSRILGVKNQPINKGDDINPKISMYNPRTKSFDDLIKGKEKEWLFIGDISENQKELLYLSLINGDFKKNMYDLYLLNIETKESSKILGNTTSTSDMKDGYIYISQGMKLYRYGFGKELEEIKLSKAFVQDLNDFNKFEFEDYLEKYYKEEVIEGKRREIIKSNYEYSRENNSIRMLSNYGNKVMLNSANGKTFIYNIEDGTYEINDELKKNNFYNKLKEEKGIVEKEFLKDGKVVLWKLDEKGNRELKIEEMSGFMRVKESPDKTKIAYNYEDENGEKGSYIYNLKTDEKITIYPEVVGNIYWNDNSKEFFITGRRILDNNKKEEISSLVRLN